MLSETDIEKLNESTIKLIGYDWMLVSAGKTQDYNTMTAAWGGLGFLWHKPVAFAFIRPPRHTFSYIEKHDYFSLSFFSEKYRDALQFCGSCSGRDTDKAKETGLVAVDFQDKTVYFAQSRLVLICRKLYYQDINPELFLDKDIQNVYPLKDYHRMYIGEIVTTLKDN